MKTIYKYPLEITHKEQAHAMDGAATILTVQMQNGFPTLWAMVDPEREPVDRHFVIFGTGWQIPERWAGLLYYVGTVQDGGFVWHVFELERPVF